MYNMTVDSRGKVVWKQDKEVEKLGRREIADAQFEKHLLRTGRVHYLPPVEQQDRSNHPMEGN